MHGGAARGVEVDAGVAAGGPQRTAGLVAGGDVGAGDRQHEGVEALALGLAGGTHACLALLHGLLGGGLPGGLLEGRVLLHGDLVVDLLDDGLAAW